MCFWFLPGSVFAVSAASIAAATTLFFVFDFYRIRRSDQIVRARQRGELRDLRKKQREYAYSALPGPETKTIRLIELFPSESNDEADIRIVTASLLDPERPIYEAVSYCWGDPSDPLPLRCSDGSLIWVTQSLHGAVRRFQRQRQTRILWADAICINQSDTDEKSWQVAMMGAIYSSAERVLIWLGEQAERSEVLEDFVPRLLLAKAVMEEKNDDRQYNQISAADMQEYGIPTMSSYGYGYFALRQVTERPWFRRVWIVQEVVLAKQAILICGHWSMPWKSLSDSWEFVANTLLLGKALDAWYGTTAGHHIGALSFTLAKASKEPLLLAHLLAWHSHAQATDPRDKVFALVGLAQPHTVAEVDYDKSFERVFCDATVRILTLRQNLDVLSLAVCRPRVTGSVLPSWSPDWRVGEVSFPLALPESARIEASDGPTGFNFRASGESTYSTVTSQNGMRLRLSGYDIDSVDRVGQALMSHRDAPVIWRFWSVYDDFRTLAGWARISGAFAGGAYECIDEAMINAFRRTLILGLPVPGEIAGIKQFEHRLRTIGFLGGPEILNRWLPFKIFSSVLVILVFVPFMFQSVGHSAPDNSWLVMVLGCGSGRRMIKTKRGFIGLASGDIRKGDSVVLLEGGKVPYIVRRTAEEDVYVLTGEAYIHDQVAGQEWDPERCRHLWLA
jgi:hypothetical protein